MESKDLSKLPKWVQRLVDSHKRDARDARALHMTDDIEPDLMPPEYGEPMSKGWVPIYVGRMQRTTEQIKQMCSGVNSHGTGWKEAKGQGPLKMYSTRLKAMKALRRAIERQAADELAEVDETIKALEQQC